MSQMSLRVRLEEVGCSHVRLRDGKKENFGIRPVLPLMPRGAVPGGMIGLLLVIILHPHKCGSVSNV